MRILACWFLGALVVQAAEPHKKVGPLFQTSDRCFACHNGLSTSAGEDVSIGFSWRPTMMANSARDPYWQAAVRREVTDNPAARDAIEDKCATCHMPKVELAGMHASFTDHWIRIAKPNEPIPR